MRTLSYICTKQQKSKYFMHTFLITYYFSSVTKFYCNYYSVFYLHFLLFFFCLFFSGFETSLAFVCICCCIHLYMTQAYVPADLYLCIKVLENFIFFSHPFQNITILDRNYSGQMHSGCVEINEEVTSPDTGQKTSLSLLLQHRVKMEYRLVGGNLQVYRGLFSPLVG